jgi:hypothetical protein
VVQVADFLHPAQEWARFGGLARLLAGERARYEMTSYGQARNNHLAI